MYAEELTLLGFWEHGDEVCNLDDCTLNRAATDFLGAGVLGRIGDHPGAYTHHVEASIERFQFGASTNA